MLNSGLSIILRNYLHFSSLWVILLSNITISEGRELEIMDTDGESSVLPGLRTRICCIWRWMWKLYTQYIIPSLEHITRKLPETACSSSAEWLLIIPIEESTNQKTEKLPDSNRSGEISSKYRKLNSVLYADFSFLPDRTSPSRPNLILKFCPGSLLTILHAHIHIM